MKSSNGTDPPPFKKNPFKEIFVYPYFRQNNVPQNVCILVILPHFSWKMSKPKKKSSSKQFEFGRPPPSLEKVQTQAEKFLKKFGFG